MKKRDVSLPSCFLIIGIFAVRFWSAGSALAQLQQLLGADLPRQAGHADIGAAAVPEGVRYRMFFRYVTHLDDFAAGLEKKGDVKAAAAWRTLLQRRAGLNDQEGEVLKRIVGDASRALAANEAQLKPALANFRAQRLDAKAAAPPEVKQLQADRKEIVATHVERLKTQLGDASFKKLDIYVTSLFHSAVTVKSPGTEPVSHALGEQ